MCEMKIIARVHTDFGTKFGIPRQSGIASELCGEVIFEPEYRNLDAVRGLDGFSHVWLIWQFSENIREGFSPTVRPPRLGGNKRIGVFATRSPFRPNPIGLSCVELESVDFDSPLAPILHIKGADLMDGTPIFDIKPYIPYTDSHPQATAGFADAVSAHHLDVDIPPALLEKLPNQKQSALITTLSQDPRPSYQSDPKRTYGMVFAGFEVKFKVDDNILEVIEIEKK
ncbi:MAG: tRNA (N6-threonylcarbamoyladenosine(37)-N6)-methyltransferase TrmO [Clostridia bacterium]|nr:tRNA (N6-threonylcarbamoyladenosine(37)-N6)-methyltransferase TrmO [Clostridia bacterium]